MNWNQICVSSDAHRPHSLREWGPSLECDPDGMASDRDRHLSHGGGGATADTLAKRSPGQSGGAWLNCLHCPGRKNGLCAGLADEAWRDMADHKAGERKISAGQDLFSAGETCEAIYNVMDGWLILYNLLEDGSRQILHFALPGAVLGFVPCDGATAYGVQALTDATVCVIPHKTLTSIAKRRPEVGMRLAWLMARDRCLAFSRMTSIGRQPACERVARLLIELFVRYRAQWPGHSLEEMYLPLTQEHIGDATGLTNVHVNRVLRDLRRKGIVEFCYRRLKIRDPDSLLEVAQLDPAVAMSWIRRPPRT